MSLSYNYSVNERVSTSRKRRADHKYVKEQATKLIQASLSDEITQRNDRWEINYRLHKGLGIDSMDELMPNLDPYESGHEKLRHIDIISPTSKGMTGEQQGRPLTGMVVDQSDFSSSFRRRAKIDTLRQVYEARYVSPIQVQEMQKYFAENGIYDPFVLTDDQRQQVRADIQARVDRATPEDIKREMSVVRRSPIEMMGQQLLDHLMKKQNVKFKTDVGFEHAICTDLESYRIVERNKEPILDTLISKGLVWDMPEGSFFLHEANWVTYREGLSFIDLLEMYGDHLTVSELRKIERKELYGGTTAASTPYYVSLINHISSNEAYYDKVFKEFNVNTRAGQAVLHKLQSEVGPQAYTFKIPVTHVNVKLPRKFYYVERVDEQGKIKWDWYDESYVSDPRRDLSVTEYWGVEAYETTHVGEVGNGVFVKTRALPWQYPSYLNPFECRISYYGAQYSRLLGQQESVSVIDLGKPGNYRYNQQVQMINKTLARDKGKVLTVTPLGKPDNYSEEQWLDMIDDHGKLILDTSNLTPTDLQYLFKGIDLSQNSELKEKYSYLEQIRNETIRAMYYNEARLGLSGERSAVANNQQDINQSTTQTRFLYSLHDQVVQSVLNGLVNVARIAYKNNPIKSSYVLDDMSLIDLELDTEMLALSEMNVFITHMGEDPYVVNIIRNQALALLQTQSIDFFDYARLMRAKSLSEIVAIAEAAVAKAQQRQMEQLQVSQEAAQQNMQFQQQMLELKLRADAMRYSEEFATRRAVAETSSLQLQNQVDVNRNHQSDLIEKANLELSYKIQKDREDRKLKMQEIRSKEKIEMAKIRSK